MFFPETDIAEYTGERGDGQAGLKNSLLTFTKTDCIIQ
jgi:hypothetical protein